MIEERSENTKIHNTVIIILTVACIGAVVESLTQGWENWVPPLIIGGIVAAWWMHVSQYRSASFRENFYITFSILVSFYHGVHKTSFFDIIVISALLMGTITLIKRKRLLYVALAEFFILLLSQTVWGFKSGDIAADGLIISRIALHVVSEICLFYVLKAIIDRSLEADEQMNTREVEKETENENMEDFLVNISHELRTPVNVINGMSTIMLKKDDSEDMRSIRDAGRRLSSQIEDIQDYSEIRRGNVLLEEDRYMITSVLNDLLINYSSMNKKSKLEFVIDLDPRVPAMMGGDVKKLSKIIRHLLDNAFKFTRRGGVYLKVSAEKKEYGANLVIEVSDTGVGMSTRDIDGVSKGLYQANKKRNRSTGGIGLGLSIVYGFVRKMHGFVNIESQKGQGTTIRITVAQEVINPAPCLSVKLDKFLNIIMYINPTKFKNQALWEYYKTMANNMAAGLRLNLYFAPTFDEMKNLLSRGDITHVFIGEEEYAENSASFDEMAKSDLFVIVSAHGGFETNKGSNVIVMPKPLYGFPIVKILNGEGSSGQFAVNDDYRRPHLDGVRALVVDDEPMNLVVATGLFREYNMIIDTADSGKEAIDKYSKYDYDLVFMDHMMPGMDGVEAMKRLKHIAAQDGKELRIIALTANAISGAKEMFLREGFDGFISKPINISDFEHTVSIVLPESIAVRKEA